MEGNERSAKRVRRHLLNIVEGEDLEALSALEKKDVQGIKDFTQAFLIKETDEFDKIIR